MAYKSLVVRAVAGSEKSVSPLRLAMPARTRSKVRLRGSGGWPRLRT